MNDHKDITQKIDAVISNRYSENYIGNVKDILEESLKNYSISETIYNFYYGVAYYYAEDFKKALDYMQKSYELEKNHLTTRMLGIIYYALGEYKETITYGKEALMHAADDEYVNDIVKSSQFYVAFDEVNDLIYNTDVLDENYFANIAMKLEENFEKKYVTEDAYNYQYALAYNALSEYEEALEYAKKSYELRKTPQNIRLLTILYDELENSEKVLEYGMEYYEIEENDWLINAICARNYYDLDDTSSAFDMIKNIDYTEDRYLQYVYLIVTTDIKVYEKQSEEFNKKIIDLFWDNKEKYVSAFILLYNVIRFSASTEDKRLNDWATNCVMDNEGWQDDVYLRYYTYFYRIKICDAIGDFDEAKKVFEMINLDKKLQETEDYFAGLKRRYLQMLYNHEHPDFKSYVADCLSREDDLEIFLNMIDRKNGGGNIYLEYLYSLAVEGNLWEYIKFYGFDTLFGYNEIKQDVEKAKKLFELSNDIYKKEFEKDSPCIIRYMSECEAGLGNYEKAYELAYISAINSDEWCNCGTAMLAELIIDPKTSYDVEIGKEIIRRSVDGYVLKENFEYEKKENYRNVDTIDIIYAHFALKGCEGFEIFKAVEILQDRIANGETNCIENNYYMAKMLKKQGKNYDKYYEKFLDLLKSENEALNGKKRQEFFKKLTNLDNEPSLFIAYYALSD